jgi:coenzyme PQQ biosynthesis protein PqqD
MTSVLSRPRLAPKVRLRFDRKTETYLLLYPEKGLALNETGAAIAQLCTGEHSVGDIVETLCQKYPEQGRDRIEREVGAFLGALADRALIVDAAPESAAGSGEP